MTRIETLVGHEVRSLAPELTDRFANAQDKALRTVSEYSQVRVRRIMSALGLRAALSQEALHQPELGVDGWRIETEPHHMMSLTLVNPEKNISLKILKERSAYPGGVSPVRPGTSRAAYFVGTEPMFGEPDTTRLLLLYDIKGWESSTHWEVPLRVVRALDNPKYGAKVPLDFSIPVVADVGFYESLPFNPEEVPDENLFARVDNEEYQRGG